MSAILKIKNFELSISLGVFPEEKKERKSVLVDIELRFSNSPKGCDTDNIGDTICYANLVNYIEKSVEGLSFNLIEALSKYIYVQVKNYVNCSDIAVSVESRKIHLPIKNVEYTSFRYGDF